MHETGERHNSGTIRQRGKRWQVDAMVNGRRVRRAAKSKKAAQELLTDLTLQNQSRPTPAAFPRSMPTPELTITDMLRRYLESTRLHCRPRTIRTTEAAVTRLSEFYKNRSAASLSRTDIDRFTAHRLAQGVGPHTPNRDLACLRAALTQAKDDGLIERAPKIRMLRTVQGLPRILTPNQIQRLIRGGGELRVVFATAATSGMRAAEIRWLTWKDVDLEEGQIEIRAKLDWRPKSHAERIVQVPDNLIDILRRHRKMVCSNPSDWVFPVPSHGGQWTETGLSHAGRRLAQRAGVWERGCKPLHDLRRSWASHLLGAGTPMDTVRRLGGWASNATLEKFYLAPTQVSIEKAVAASASLLSKPT